MFISPRQSSVSHNASMSGSVPSEAETYPDPAHSMSAADVMTAIVDEINFFIQIPPIEPINSHPLK